MHVQWLWSLCISEICKGEKIVLEDGMLVKWLVLCPHSSNIPGIQGLSLNMLLVFFLLFVPNCPRYDLVKVCVWSPVIDRCPIQNVCTAVFLLHSSCLLRKWPGSWWISYWTWINEWTRRDQTVAKHMLTSSFRMGEKTKVLSETLTVAWLLMYFRNYWSPGMFMHNRLYSLQNSAGRMPCWLERSEENGQPSSCWQEGYSDADKYLFPPWGAETQYLTVLILDTWLISFWLLRLRLALAELVIFSRRSSQG